MKKASIPGVPDRPPLIAILFCIAYLVSILGSVGFLAWNGYQEEQKENSKKRGGELQPYNYKPYQQGQPTVEEIQQGCGCTR